MPSIQSRQIHTSKLLHASLLLQEVLTDFAHPEADTVFEFQIHNLYLIGYLALTLILSPQIDNQLPNGHLIFLASPQLDYMTTPKLNTHYIPVSCVNKNDAYSI